MSAPAGAAWGTKPGKMRRTGQPVRRNSYHVGEREHRIWRPLGATKKDAWRYRDAVVRAARRFDDASKRDRGPGAKIGALGLTGVRVLETLLSIVDLMSGRLEPAIATIAAKACLGRRTVVRALARLRDAGFLAWLRRTENLDNDGAGPQVQQATNAYWFALRGRATGLVRLMLGRAPPDAKTPDEVQEAHRGERLNNLAAMRHRTSVAAADVLSPEAKESLRLLRERRSASAVKAQNPGSQG